MNVCIFENMRVCVCVCVCACACVLVCLCACECACTWLHVSGDAYTCFSNGNFRRLNKSPSRSTRSYFATPVCEVSSCARQNVYNPILILKKRKKRMTASKITTMHTPMSVKLHKHTCASLIQRPAWVTCSFCFSAECPPFSSSPCAPHSHTLFDFLHDVSLA